MSHPLISIQHLTWHYPREDQLIFDNFSLQLHAGDFCFLTGRSGTGKTTLVKFLLRQVIPPTKMIFYNKEDIARFSRREVQAYRTKIGVVFQDFKLIERMNVRENIQFPLVVHGLPVEKEKKHLDHLLDLLGLTNRANAFPAQLSGGERQRVAIARALVMHPHLIIADEPTGNIDDDAAKNIADKFVALHKEGYTILFITHDRQLQTYVASLTSTKDVHLGDEKSP